MKTITVTSVTVDGSDITIVGTIADTTLTSPSQRVTIEDSPIGNKSWFRAVRLVTDTIQCLRVGSSSVAMYVTSWTKIAVAVENSLSWVPRFSTQPHNTTVAHSANTSLAVVQNTGDELAATFKWYRQIGSADFVEITGATTPNDGCTYSTYTTATLNITSAAIGQNGYKYKCVATNGAGSTTSTTVTLTVT